MAGRLDPEEWAGIMKRAMAYLIGPVTRHEGKVARLVGDAILAFTARRVLRRWKAEVHPERSKNLCEIPLELDPVLIRDLAVVQFHGRNKIALIGFQAQ